jgi:hypothetical protein
MNPDQVLIQAGYEDAVKRLYATFFMGFQDAGGVPALEQQAEQNFSAGLAIARKSRERAIALLGKAQAAE